MKLQIDHPLVTSDWLYANFNHPNLIILNATIPKVTSKEKVVKTTDKEQIKGALFFDITNQFSDKKASLPNTMLSSKDFEKEAQKIGINKDSCIVVYDDYGLYSAPRVWWMFQLMGFTNIAVLDGGLPEWKSKNYPIEKETENLLPKGNFKANFQPNKIVFTEEVLQNITSDDALVVDARSKGRFFATEPEPRSDVKGGHIPKSVSMPHTEITQNNSLKSKEELVSVYQQINPKNKPLIFSCGSGITASVLALGAEIAGFTNHAVYDGSWTEWGTTDNLPIKK